MELRTSNLPAPFDQYYYNALAAIPRVDPVVDSRSSPLLSELVEITPAFEYPEDGFTFGSLFEDFDCEFLDQFVFDDVSIGTEQEQTATGTDTVVVFDGTLGMDDGALAPFADFLGMTSGLRMSARINIGSQTLSGKIKPKSVILRSEADFNLPITQGVVLREGAFQVSIIQKVDYIKRDTYWTLVPYLTGSIEFSNLSTNQPVMLDCLLTYSNGTLHASAVCDSAKGLFGYPNLEIKDFVANFDVGNANNIDISGYIDTGSHMYGLGGKISSAGSGLYVSVEQFTLTDLNELFMAATTETVSVPDYDITFNDVLVGFATESCTIGDVYLQKGFTLSGGMTVHGHTCSMTAVISNSIISFNGSIGNLDIGPVHIESAALSLRLYRASSGVSSEFSITGRSVIQGITVDCKLVYQKYEGQWECLVYGSLSGSSLSVSTVLPMLAGSALDQVKFSKAAFVYSTRDYTTPDPELVFPLKKGIQLLGVLDEVPGLSTVTGTSSIGLVLCARFGAQVDIFISSPEARLNLGPSVVCDPFTIQITCAPQFAFRLIFGMDVIIPSQADPLHFDVRLELGASGASGSGTMIGYWRNPFGINNVTVGPILALDIKIVYGSTPQIGIIAGLDIGGVTSQVALNVSQDPTKLILMGELNRLTPNDIAVIGKSIANIDIPLAQIPAFFEFYDVKLYFAPTGGTIGTVRFDPGFSFAARMVLFGKEISTYTSLSTAGFISMGKIEGFEIGPLKIRGKIGEDAQYRIELTGSKQSLFVDGAIEFLGAYAAIYADISTKGARIEFESDLPLCGFSVKDAYLVANTDGIIFNGRMNVGESNVSMHGEIYPDGRFQFLGNAVLQIMGYSLANGEVSFSNNGLSVKGKATVAGSVVALSGEIRSNGQFLLTGLADINIVGYNVAGASFRLDNGGFAGSGSLSFAGLAFSVSLSIQTNGQFSGKGTASLGPYVLAGLGITLGELYGTATLSVSNSGVFASFAGKTCVLGYCSDMSGSIGSDGVIAFSLNVCLPIPIPGINCWSACTTLCYPVGYWTNACTRICYLFGCSDICVPVLNFRTECSRLCVPVCVPTVTWTTQCASVGFAIDLW